MTRLLERTKLVGSTLWAVVAGAGMGLFAVVVLGIYRLVLAVLAFCAAVVFSFLD